MNTTINKLIDELNDIPTMPNVVIKALRIVQDPESSIKDLGDIISCDQSLSLKVLTMVNSAYYGFSTEITSIPKALAYLGMNKTKNLIIAVAMKQMFSSGRNKALWEHSLTAAIGCEFVAEHLNLSVAGEAFVMGLMHDIGKIVINMQDEDVLKKIDECVSEGTDITEAENTFFGTNHAEIGAALAKKWQLPVLFTNIIKYHHRPLDSAIPTECSLVYLVDKLIQPNFKENFLNDDYIKDLNIKLDKPMILRNSILHKASGLIKELSV